MVTGCFVTTQVQAGSCGFGACMEGQPYYNEADKNYAKTHAWWNEFGAIFGTSLKKLERWFAWWNARRKQWGNWLKQEMFLENNILC